METEKLSYSIYLYDNDTDNLTEFLQF